MLREILAKDMTVEETEKKINHQMEAEKPKPKTKKVSQNGKDSFEYIESGY